MPNSKTNNQSADWAHHFDPSILREYDIRGVIGENLSNNDAYAIGRCFASYVHDQGGQHIGIVYDGRQSSPDFADHLANGIIDSGLQAVMIGMGPTPLLYYALKTTDYIDAGVMITGSHNPPDYNGLKLSMKNGPFFGQDIKMLGRMAADGNVRAGNGEKRHIDLTDDYIDMLIAASDFEDDMSVIWDCGNGVTGTILPNLVEQLPGTHDILYADVDGQFPNHHPDPAVADNMRDLQNVVLDAGADIGIAFDGDGDRLGAVDEQGRVISNDQLNAIFIRDILTNRDDGTIICDIKTSQAVFDQIAEYGGTPVMGQSGHSYMKQLVNKHSALYAGELSGHCLFNDRFYGVDDALYGAIRLLNICSKITDGIGDVAQKLPRLFPTPEYRIEVPEDKKFDIVARLIETATKKADENIEIIDIDGIRAISPDGWWLLRASNTQNVISIRAEGKSESALEKLTDQLNGILASANISLPE
jgi:phosphomannomutase